MRAPNRNTPDFILEKVAPVFNQKGYVATSLTDITNATGLTKGAVYCNFENKEELAKKAFIKNAEQVLLPLGKLIRAEKNSPSKLKAITNYYRHFKYNLTLNGGCPILNTCIDAKNNNAELFIMAKAAMNNILESIEKVLTNGIRFQQIKPDTNVKTFSHMMYAAIEGAVFMSMVNDNNEYLKSVADYLDQLIDSIAIVEIK